MELDLKILLLYKSGISQSVFKEWISNMDLNSPFGNSKIIRSNCNNYDGRIFLKDYWYSKINKFTINKVSEDSVDPLSNYLNAGCLLSLVNTDGGFCLKTRNMNTFLIVIFSICFFFYFASLKYIICLKSYFQLCFFKWSI